MEKKITFGEALIAERKRLGWIRTTLSDRTGIPYETLSNWERRGGEPAEYVKMLLLHYLRGL